MLVVKARKKGRVEMPYKSDAQRRKFHAMEKEGKMAPKVVEEFDEASKGMSLPEKKEKAGHGYCMNGKHCEA